ncbi:serine/threonine protein kinase [Ktedonobacteria bacterium brp13]|nr:serine/threonine protein kinase [Ktedonobacteria bacterium brp13]
MNDQKEFEQTENGIETLGRYRIARRIGRGGMGEVWLCEDPRLIRQVAIKTLPAHNQQDKNFAKHFEREAEAAAALNHPHILPVHDYGKQSLPDGTIVSYIVMPYISGGSLADRITSASQQQLLLPLQDTLAFLEQAAQAIDYAHKKRLIHRDIKPANMLLREDNWLFLADFGIARIISSEENLTGRSVAAGTPLYMAPEQARGKATITSDNYSLAVVAYQLCTGRLPFENKTALATMMMHQLEPVPSPRQFNPTLPSAFEQILLQGLEKDPAARPALACEFVAQLRQAISNPTYQPTPLQTVHDLPRLDFQERTQTQQPDEQHARISRRDLLLGGGAIATITTGVGLGAWGYWQTTQGSQKSLPTPQYISARPKNSGDANAPALVLTGSLLNANNLLWSKDASLLFSLEYTYTLFRWDVASLLKQPDKPYGSTFYSGKLSYPDNQLCATISPDRTQFAVANSEWDDTKTQVALYTLDLRLQSTINMPPSGNFGAITWLTNNNLCFTRYGSDDLNSNKAHSYLYVVDPTRPQRQWTILLNTLITSGGKTSGGSPVATVLADPTPDSSRAVIGYEDYLEVGKVTISNNATWTVLSRIHVKISSSKTSQWIDWTPDGKNLVMLTTRDTTHPQGRVVYMSASMSKPPVQDLNTPSIAGLESSVDGYNCLACNPNPANTPPLVAVGTADGNIYIWKLQAGSSYIKKLGTDRIQAGVATLAWSPDGKWLAASFQDNQASILIWKIG